MKSSVENRLVIKTENPLTTNSLIIISLIALESDLERNSDMKNDLKKLWKLFAEVRFVE